MATRPKILVIDDEDMMFNLLKMSVGPLGYDFLKAANTSDFNTLIEEEKINVMILDYLMPIKNGMDVAKEVRTQHPNLPILFLTSKQLSTEETKLLMKLGMDYVRKPFIPQQISGKIKEVLSRQQA